MEKGFEKVMSYIGQLDYLVTHEDTAEELVVIQNEDAGITNMALDCEGEILIMEQSIMDVPASNREAFYEALLKMNRNIVHGAFVLDCDGKKVIFRDTLQLANIDLNELEASINSLSLALAENANQLLTYTK